MSQLSSRADSWLVWGLRALWLSLPFTAGQVCQTALDGSSKPIELTATVGLWLVWSFIMIVTVVPNAVTLTLLRIFAPASFVPTVWGVLANGPTDLGIAGLALTGATAVVSLSPPLGSRFINGSSYGNEWRVSLRPPGLLLIGPIPLFWALCIAALVSGPMLLAAEKWLLGPCIVLVGFPMALIAGRSLHALAQRWLVFVPAGLVLHDLMHLPDPVLFKRNNIAIFGPALSDTSAIDLSQGALGLPLELQLHAPAELSYRSTSTTKTSNDKLDSIVISVSRPGLVLSVANGRGIPVG